MHRIEWGGCGALHYTAGSHQVARQSKWMHHGHLTPRPHLLLHAPHRLAALDLQGGPGQRGVRGGRAWSPTPWLLTAVATRKSAANRHNRCAPCLPAAGTSHAVPITGTTIQAANSPTAKAHLIFEQRRAASHQPARQQCAARQHRHARQASKRALQRERGYVMRFMSDRRMF